VTVSSTSTPVGSHPTVAWSRRVRRVGGLIQVAFAAFWLGRASLTVGGGAGAALAGASLLVLAAVCAYGVRTAAAPRPIGPEARRIERAVTLATILQLVASFVAPVIAGAVGQGEWALPSVAITIGPLLLWLGRRVDIPRYRGVGWALIIGPVALVSAISGAALAITVGFAAGVLLLATATAGFHDLARSDPRPG